MNLPPMPLSTLVMSRGEAPAATVPPARKPQLQISIYGVCRRTGQLAIHSEPIAADNSWCRSVALGRAAAKLFDPRVIHVEPQ